MLARAPYYHLVPKDLAANLEFRKDLLKIARRNEDDAHDLWVMCSRDLLFFLNAFGWTYDPRLPLPEVPFITYPFQDEAFTEIQSAVGSHDIVIEKSRDMGASWMCVTVFAWFYLFRPMMTFLAVSRTEQDVDKTEDPDCLFWKIDYLIGKLPRFLRPNHTRLRLHYHNEDNGSTIDGRSTTGNVGRGGRRTAALLDEFAAFEVADGYKALAATQAMTPCRIFNSTPQGTGNAHYDMVEQGRNPDSGVKLLRMHWSEHPVKSVGLYQANGQELNLLDKEYWRNRNVHDYAFVRDGKLRSPWYDVECQRTPIPLLIKQELDIDYLGSGSQFFDTEVLDRCMERTLPPIYVGHLEYDPDALQVHTMTPNEKGCLRLWTTYDAAMQFPGDREYVIGADISGGTGASNSVAVVGDRKTGELVAEYATPNEMPEKFAETVVVLARWFNDAFLIWEANGPGRQFGNRVVDLKYRRIYFRKQEGSLSARSTDFPGWYATRDTKRTVLGEFNRAIGDGACLPRSKELLKEAAEYCFLQDGSIGHSRSVATIDRSGAKDNHGDRVMAASLCWKGLQSRPVKKERVIGVPEGSFAYRRQLRQKRERQLAEAW